MFHRSIMSRSIFASRRAALAFVLVLSIATNVQAALFTLVNRCPYNVWPAIQTTSSGRQVINGGGFSLGPGQRTSLGIPDSWSGRLWPRTGCNFDGNGRGSCVTGDCGNGLRCNGNGYRPPVLLAEFTLGGWSGLTFYDVSAVDGFNAPLSISPTNGASANPNDYRCGSPSCLADINGQCLSELRQTNNNAVVACKSGCIAFQQPQYCCTGSHNQPSTCPPTNYSRFFKQRCPTAYSYAFDDPTSTFTCSVRDFTIAFCSTKLSSSTAEEEEAYDIVATY